MKCSIWLLVLVMMVTVGCMNESSTAPETASPLPELIPQAPKTAPFHAHEENTILCHPSTPDCGPGPDGIAHVIFPGVIEGDHIGSATILTNSQVDFVSGACLPAGQFCQAGQGVITAANGDELLWAFEGIGNFDPDGVPGAVVFSGDFWFLPGGTGRFANASGGGTYDGSADTAAGVGEFDLDGVISR